MNILLVCSAGMSTSMVVKRMEEAATAQGLEAKIWAIGDAELAENLASADIVLLGPQVRFLLDRVREQAAPKPVMVMDMSAYGRLDGPKILNDALEALQK